MTEEKAYWSARVIVACAIGIVLILIISALTGCSKVAFFVATGKVESKKTPKPLTAAQRAINIAILKYSIDDTWAIGDIQKEIRYQQYLARQTKAAIAQAKKGEK